MTAERRHAGEEAGAAPQTLAKTAGESVAWMLDHAPLDDESETEEERRAVAEAHADRERASGLCRLRTFSPSSTAIAERVILARRR
jgi:hypothetical protein